MGFPSIGLMLITVAYWLNDAVTNVTGSWAGMPAEGVLWVQVPNRRLQGFDNYWVHENCYGVFNDSENYDLYEGLQAIAFCDTDEGEVQLEDPSPPEGIQILRGQMLTDEQAKTVGLL